MDRASRVIPAQLSYITIFCPRLGATEETFRDQVVFHYSRRAGSKRRRGANVKITIDGQSERSRQDEDNNMLRQIGLAQAMVDFARNFSVGKPVESIETDKTRAVIYQLEKGWWLVASIDLTRIPLDRVSADKSSSPTVNDTEVHYEHSSREVAPPELMAHHISRAQSLFTLHHGSCLDDLFLKLGRTKFCSTLSRFWAWFASDWNVLLHGNPSVDIMGGIKLAAGGELGIGVGEEEWGSGEREVLEHIATRTNGLIDMLVARFGDVASNQQAQRSDEKVHRKDVPWIGSGQCPGAEDGVIFSGMKALQAQSRHDIAEWMQSIYTHGESAYGVKDNPLSHRRKRRLRKAETRMPKERTAPLTEKLGSEPKDVKPNRKVTSVGPETDDRPGIPPPIVDAANASLSKATTNVKSHRRQEGSINTTDDISSLTDPQVWMSVLTLGYGSSWTFSKKESAPRPSEQGETYLEPENFGKSAKYTSEGMNRTNGWRSIKESKAIEEALKLQEEREEKGYFMIGYQGDLEKESQPFAESRATDENQLVEDMQGWNSRLLLRTVHVKLNSRATSRLQRTRSSNIAEEGEEALTQKRLIVKRMRVRVVVFVYRPFIFTLLFEPETPSLSFPTLYRNFFNFLSPLHKSLCLRTSPSRAALRVPDQATMQYLSPAASSLASSPLQQPIYDIIYNPMSLAIHSSLPNIPEPGSLAIDPLGERWTRADALNVHSQILAMRSAITTYTTNFERLVKTGRGWWVVWMRVTTTASAENAAEEEDEEGEEEEEARLAAEAEMEEENDNNGDDGNDNDEKNTEDDEDKDTSKSTENKTDGHDSKDLTESSVTISDKRRSVTRAKKSRMEASTVSPSIREAILVRRARDHVATGTKAVGASGDAGRSEAGIFGFGSRPWTIRPGATATAAATAASSTAGGGDGGGGEGGEGVKRPSRLVEGIGIDARKYVEGLLSFNR